MAYAERSPAGPGPKNSSFRFRRLRIVLTLSRGTFASGQNALVIDNLAMKARIQKVPFPDSGKASIEIVGMKQSDMEALTTLAMRPLFHRARNYLNIYAGDDESGLTEVFAGNITRAYADFNSAPNVAFKAEAQVEQVGFAFENLGVTSSLKNCVFNGSPINQAYQAAHAVGAELILDDRRAVLMPSGSAVRGNAVLIRPDSGMLSYPVINQNGIDVKTIFNPAYRYAGLVQLDTNGLIPKADGSWRIIKLSHSLTANDPKSGTWESSMTLFYPHLSGVVGRFI